MNKDKLTTILGIIVGTAQAAQTYATTMPAGEVTAQTWIGFGLSILFAAWGFFTNKV